MIFSSREFIFMVVNAVVLIAICYQSIVSFPAISIDIAAFNNSALVLSGCPALTKIAARYHTDVWAIARANGITNLNRIHIGQVLCIPVSSTPPACPTTYVVQRGDTLLKIANRFHVSVLALRAANQIDDIDFIIFQLNTANPCGPRTAIRCTATSFLNTNASTGLNANSFDVNESIGYTGIEDAYLQQINMTAGTSYAILINNTNATNGFNLNWGGTGTFVGPDANITGGPFTLCAGNSISFNGNTKGIKTCCIN